MNDERCISVPVHLVKSVLRAAQAFGVSGPGFDALQALVPDDEAKPLPGSEMAVTDGE